MHTTPTAARAQDRQTAYRASAERTRQVRQARAAASATPTTPIPRPNTASCPTTWMSRIHRVRALVAGRGQMAVSR
jgi:hypothetical protein